MLEMHFNTLFRLQKCVKSMKINEIMTKSHAKTYGSHEMVRVKIALSRAPERALIRRLYGPEGTTRTGKGAYPSPTRMHDLCRG